MSIAAAALACIAAYAPVALAVGVPIELPPLLLAVDTISDMFAPAANVTADVTITTILAEGARENAGQRQGRRMNAT